MANRTRPTLEKRAKERARQEKRQKKEERRANAKVQLSAESPARGAENPDIAGIVPGPRPRRGGRKRKNRGKAKGRGLRAKGRGLPRIVARTSTGTPESLTGSATARQAIDRGGNAEAAGLMEVARIDLGCP